MHFRTGGDGAVSPGVGYDRVGRNRVRSGAQQARSHPVRATFFDATSQASLERLGYAVIPFLDEDAIAELEAVYWRLGPAPGDPQMTIHFDFQSESASYKEKVAHAVRPMLEPRIDKVLDRYHLFSPNYIMKWPGARSGFAPHQDTSLVDESRHRSVTIWCPLTDTIGGANGDNGVIRFVPGSHDFVEWIRAHDPGAFAFPGLEQEIIDHYGVEIPLRAGEAIVFDHRTVHFSMPNSNPDPRLVIAMGLRPDEADLLHYRRHGHDQFDVYEIDDDYYINLNPFALREGVPGYAQVDRITMARPVVTPESFDAMCRRVGAGPLRTDGLGTLVPRESRRVNADPFCFKCGTQEHLIGEADRAEHGNLQLLCETCHGRLQAAG